jgi:hypothetical protein
VWLVYLNFFTSMPGSAPGLRRSWNRRGVVGWRAAWLAAMICAILLRHSPVVLGGAGC